MPTSPLSSGWLKIKRFQNIKSETGSADLGRPSWVILNTILIFFLSQLAAGLVVGLVLVASHKSYDNSIWAQFTFILLAVCIYGLLIGFWLKRRKLNWGAVGLGRKPLWRDLKSAALGLLVLIGFSIIVGLLLSLISPDLNNQRQDLGFNNPHSGLNYALAFSALVILPAIGEETLMRGYLYSGLRRWWAIPEAALVTSLIFAAPHLFEGRSSLLWAAALDTFILSFILIYLREKTGALYSGMIVHGLNNLLAFGVYFHGLILLR